MIRKTVASILLAITLSFTAPTPTVITDDGVVYLFNKDSVKETPKKPMSEGTKRAIKYLLGAGAGIMLFSGYRFYQFKRLNK